MAAQSPPPRDDHDHGRSSSHDSPTSDLLHGSPHKPAIPDPVRVGPYRIVRRIGEKSGMGLVFLAMRDDDQFKKRVAVKVIKPGMDSETILHRFEQERQVLAALNHPNIARFLDGGLTDDGRPYFVMEYIEGQAITEYCDKNRLKIEERLEMFNALCKAVHHAHQNLVVHRDIKPSNVVVTPDGDVKLLDFGIAKLLNPELAMIVGDPTATEFRVMTPEYASPEQVRGDPITTASDIYSLGVLLYELLTGRRPYRIKTRVQKEIERVVCHEEPEKPSTAITHAPPIDEDAPTSDLLEGGTAAPTGTTVEEVAKLRVLKPERLRKRLAGDIDNIVLMAMRKEPKRRYASAEQFCEDIRRHLHGDPVIARPSTLAYRVSKFVQRNKGLAAAMALVAISLTTGFTVAMVQWQRAEAQKVKAQTAEQVAIEQRDAVTRLRNLAREFPAEILDSFDEEIKNTPGALAVRELMVKHATKYLEQLERENSSDLAVKFDIALGYVRIGDIQGGLRRPIRGDVDVARTSYEKSAALWRQLIEANPTDVRARQELANCQIKLAGTMGDSDETLEIYTRVERDMEPLRLANPKDSKTTRVMAIALLEASDILRRRKQFEDAGKLIERSIALRHEILSLNPSDERAEREVGVGLSRRAALFDNMGREGEALKAYQEHLELRQRMFDKEPENAQRLRDLMNAHHYTATLLERTHDEQAARVHYETAASLAQRQWNQELQSNARARNDYCSICSSLSRIYRKAGDRSKSLQSAEQALTIIALATDKQGREQKAMALRMHALSLQEFARIHEARTSAIEAREILLSLNDPKLENETKFVNQMIENYDSELQNKRGPENISRN